jgi:hypothetical protein
MRLLLLLLVCTSPGVAQAADSFTNATPASLTNRCAEFELRDQFDKQQAIKFPAAKPILLIVADKKGSEGIEGWAQPLGVRFGERIRISGLADVSAVPQPIRGFVQGRFKKAIAYPTMLDWEGKICAGFKYEKGRPNIYLISRDGRFLEHYSGGVDEKRLKQLITAMQTELDSPSAP